MKLVLAVLATSAALAHADPKSAAARFNNVRRQLSFKDIAGYKPDTQVTDHCAMDLDQQQMESELALMTPESFNNARAIFNEGGHSKSYARITLTSGLQNPIKKNDIVLGKNAAGIEVSGKAAQDYDRNEQVIKVYYTTTDVPESYVGCRVGALTDTLLDGCFINEGNVKIGSSEYAYVYEPESDNRADRTLAGFSQQAGDKMRLNCKGCPYTDFVDFYNYYGRDDYAHHWVEKAFEGTSTSFTRGDADFSKFGMPGREQAIKKGSAYLSVFMYVIREFEDAIDDCETQSLDNNYNAVHAWDEGVCFYTGSIEGVDGATDDGKLLHQLADKRCANFKTCGEDGSSLDGMAKVNHDLFDLLALGNHQLATGECSLARQTVQKITRKMFIPMIQGTLRYAYKMSKLGGSEVENAEGATFAAAVLPKVHAISPQAATTIYNNMRVGQTNVDHVSVKRAFESVYGAMGISCQDIGGLWFDGTNDYYEGMEPCGGAVVAAESSAAYTMGAFASLCISAVLYFSL